MIQYSSTAYILSQKLTHEYSTSFGISSRLLKRQMRKHIYAVYGLVRISDEIADCPGIDDTYRLSLLNSLEQEVYSAIERQYSANPLVHSFAMTAKIYGIDRSLIEPFFGSMRMDIQHAYTPKYYNEYIHGSAEVIGLMCLKVFCHGEKSLYNSLELGARKLGAAFQKVNFLRDFAADYKVLNRVYFPGVNFIDFTDAQKREIEQDIETDFADSEKYIRKLPRSARIAVRVSNTYYKALFKKIQHASVDVIKLKRIRIGSMRKFLLLCKARLMELA